MSIDHAEDFRDTVQKYILDKKKNAPMGKKEIYRDIFNCFRDQLNNDLNNIKNSPKYKNGYSDSDTSLLFNDGFINNDKIDNLEYINKIKHYFPEEKELISEYCAIIRRPSKFKYRKLNTVGKKRIYFMIRFTKFFYKIKENENDEKYIDLVKKLNNITNSLHCEYYYNDHTDYKSYVQKIIESRDDNKFAEIAKLLKF